jgi:hypothetical protein
LSRPLLTYERKLSPSFSINTGLHAVLTTSNEFNIEKLGLSIEPRYYLGMKKGIETGQRANNLSGNYIGLQAAYVRYDFGHSNFIPQREGYFALLKLGMQRRLLRYGFVDFSAGLGVAKSTVTDIVADQQGFKVNTEEKWHPALNLQAAIGLAYGEGRPEDGRLCNVLLCYREDKDLFKINLIDIVQQIGFDQYTGSLGLAYERKIAQTAWSVELGGTANYQRVAYTDYAIDNIGGTLYVEPRYYYNLNKRMALGKSVDNLSGNFVALRTGVEYSRIEILVENELNTIYDSNYFVLPSWGIQRRIFKNGYFSYQLGFEVNELERLTKVNENLADLAFRFTSDFKLGLAF